MIRVDLHSHTNHSHAKDTVRQMFEAASKAGLDYFGFSEHSPRPLGYDYPTEYRDHLTATFDDYIKEVNELREEQSKKGKTVLLGLEVDWLEDEVPYLKKMISQNNYDYLIGGIHFLGKWGFDSCAADWEKLSFEQKCALFTQYYLTMKKMAESGLFRIVAHPDLIKIFSVGDFHKWLEQPKSLRYVYDAFKAAKASDMALEISSAGLRKPCQEIYPCQQLLHIARDLDMNITFASDSHSTAQVAWKFDELAKYASEAGWTESVVFSGNCSIFLGF